MDGFAFGIQDAAVVFLGGHINSDIDHGDHSNEIVYCVPQTTDEVALLEMKRHALSN